MIGTLRDVYGQKIAEVMKDAYAPSKIDETNVYQEANPVMRKNFQEIMGSVMLPESKLVHPEIFKDFYQQVQNGKRGLILMEHYSNFDLPGLMFILERYGEDWSVDFSHKVVAVAGMKLNEASPMVRCLTEAFSRVVIYPTRSLEKATGDGSELSEEEKAEEEKRARKINFAAMRAMDTCKKNGQIILVFPSGTRYRPGKPETKKGLKEIDSYLRLFDLVLPITINGSCLTINPEAPEDMTKDLVQTDRLYFTAHPILECKTFRQEVLDSLPADEPDPKQKIIDKIMEILEIQHDEIEKIRNA